MDLRNWRRSVGDHHSTLEQLDLEQLELEPGQTTESKGMRTVRATERIATVLYLVLAVLVALLACAVYLCVVHSLFVFKGAATEAAVTGAMRNAEAMIASLDAYGKAAARLYVQPDSGDADLNALWTDDAAAKYAPSTEQTTALRDLVFRTRTVENSIVEITNASTVIVHLLREFEAINGTAHVGHAVQTLDELTTEAKRLLDMLESGDLGFRIGR